MASIEQKRKCPFCGTLLLLAELPVVATNHWSIAGARSLGDRGRLPSGSAFEGFIGQFPVLQCTEEAPAAPKRRLFGKAQAPLRPVRDLFAHEDLPKRLCPNCEQALPLAIDDYPIFTIGVVGTQEAGKTYFIASMLYEALKLQLLRYFGCIEFYPEEETNEEYQERYFEPMFMSARLLERTQVDAGVRYRPLIFRVRFENSEPFVLMFHDVAGEIFQDRHTRASSANFLQGADGLICLVDPAALVPSLSWRLEKVRNQATLLHACISDSFDGRSVGSGPPVAIVVTKSDLMAPFFPGGRPLFSRYPERSRDTWKGELKLVHGEVQRLLQSLEAYDILSASARLPSSKYSFHAVSQLGYDLHPESPRLPYKPAPIRCLEPLAAILHRIPGII